MEGLIVGRNLVVLFPCVGAGNTLVAVAVAVAGHRALTADERSVPQCQLLAALQREAGEIAHVRGLEVLKACVGEVCVAAVIAVPELAVRAGRSNEQCIGISQHIQESKAGIQLLRLGIDADNIVGIAVRALAVVEDLRTGNVVFQIVGGPAGQIAAGNHSLGVLGLGHLGGTVIADGIGVQQAALICLIVPLQALVVQAVGAEDAGVRTFHHVGFQQIRQLTLTVALHTIPHCHAGKVRGIGTAVQHGAVVLASVIVGGLSLQHRVHDIQQVIHRGDFRRTGFLVDIPANLDSVALGGVGVLVGVKVFANIQRQNIQASGFCAAIVAHIVERCIHALVRLDMGHLVKVIVQIQQHSALNHRVKILDRDVHDIRQITAGEDSIGLFIGISPDIYVEASRGKVVTLVAADDTTGQVGIFRVEGNGGRFIAGGVGGSCRGAVCRCIGLRGAAAGCKAHGHCAGQA